VFLETDCSVFIFPLILFCYTVGSLWKKIAFSISSYSDICLNGCFFVMKNVFICSIFRITAK
jgi:hypothetical protein